MAQLARMEPLVQFVMVFGSGQAAAHKPTHHMFQVRYNPDVALDVQIVCKDFFVVAFNVACNRV